MDAKPTVTPKRKPLARERFAAGRAARYAEQTNNVAPMMRLPTEYLCPGCEKGYGIVVGTQARRTMLECDYCSRRFFPSTMERP
jgi:DNA-directed RNA polymerase subunit RPC12/RpoP